MTFRVPTRVLYGRSAGPHLLITGGVHGDEFEPMAAIRRLAGLLAEGDFCGRVTLVPVANEAAFRRGARLAEDSLDMARAFPGRPDGTITEKAAHQITTLIRTADYYIDLHTGGTALRLLPLAGYMLHRDPAVLAIQRRMAHAFNFPVVWGTDWRLEGRSLSAARDAQVPAIYVEYRGGAMCRPEGVNALVEGCLNVMGVLEMCNRPAPSNGVRYVVEDERPGSGHLQTQHPSPMAGFFLPCVRLEDRVNRGDVLGEVCDELGDTVYQITAKQSGIVLALRVLPRVNQGDALAVILET